MKEPTRLLTIERKKNPERGLKGVPVPASLLMPEAESTQPFQPVVNAEELLKLHKVNSRFSTAGFTTAAAGSFGTMAIITGTGFVGPHGSGLSTVIGAGVSLLPLFGGAMLAMISDSKYKLKKKALERHAERSLKRWLSQRYNIEEVQLGRWAGEVLAKRWQPGARLLNFVDGNGKKFALMAGAEGLFVEETPELPKPFPKDYAPSGTPAALSPAKVTADGEAQAKNPAEDELGHLLLGDAQVLHGRTIELLATLAKRALGIESQHVVKRVREDVRQTLVLNAELSELGEIDSEAQAQLATVFSNLNDELDEVLESERASVKKSIATQVGYVKGRRRALSGLVLGSAASQAPSDAPSPVGSKENVDG